MMHAEGGFCIQRTFEFLDVSYWIPHLRYSIVIFSEPWARNIMSKGLYEKDYDWIMDVLSVCGSFSILREGRRRTRLSNRIIYSCLQNSIIQQKRVYFSVTHYNTILYKNVKNKTCNIPTLSCMVSMTSKLLLRYAEQRVRFIKVWWIKVSSKNYAGYLKFYIL